VLGAEGIFSIKSLGSLMAGLTMGHFSLDAILSAATGSCRDLEEVEEVEVEEVEVEEVLARVSPRTMGSVVMVWSGVSPCVSPLPHSTTQPRLGLPA